MTIDTTTNSHLVVVYGATGSQGGSLVRSLIRNPNFRVRAITRNPASQSAQQLSQLGVDVVQADGWKKEQITAACEGAWAAFVNTNSEDPIWYNGSGVTEFDLGQTIIDGIIAAGSVRHLVYSSAASTSAFSKGRVRAQAAEMKSQIERYAIDSQAFETVCPIHPGFYMELFAIKELAGLFGGFPFFPDAEGFLTLRTPQWGADGPMPVPWVAVREDFGDIVHGVLLDPHRYHATAVPVVSDPRSYPEVTEIYQSVTGQKARYECLSSCEEFGKGIPEMEDLRRLFQFGQLTNAKYFGDADPSAALSAELKARAVEARGGGAEDKQLLTFPKWVGSNLMPSV